MKTRTKVMVLGLVMAMVFCYAGIVGAGSSSDTGAGASAAVNLDFQIVIPSFIYLRVGDAVGVDMIVFSPSVDEVATAAQDIAGTGGNLTGGAVTVILISNGGAVTLEANGNGGLSNGSDTIDFSTIETLTSNPSFQPPILANGTSSTTPPLSGNITNLSSQWTYDFDIPSPNLEGGTYSGQVTYTASIP